MSRALLIVGLLAPLTASANPEELYWWAEYDAGADNYVYHFELVAETAPFHTKMNGLIFVDHISSKPETEAIVNPRMEGDLPAAFPKWSSASGGHNGPMLYCGSPNDNCWVPSGVGDSVKWRIRADNLIEKDRLHWSFLWGSNPQINKVLAYHNDADDDGLLTTEGDNCPDTANSDQKDTDGDGVGDVCDACPLDALDDSDGDGSCDSDDTCPDADDRIDADGDLVPDACDNCVDDANDDQTDTDGNGEGDACDICPLDDPDDTDADGVCDSDDVCLGDDATGDSDADGICDDGDVCAGDDATGDTDGDGVCDSDDACEGDDSSGDADGDGYCATDADGTTVVDCDDDAATVYPDAAELCDGLDNSCSGIVPDEEADEDGDGESICGGDCNDGDPAIYSAATEECNGIDDDCSGAPGDDEVDVDEDGVLVCEDDCDDADPAVSPNAVEICNDEIDQDCSGADGECESSGGCQTSGVGGGWWALVGLLGLTRRRSR